MTRWREIFFVISHLEKINYFFIQDLSIAGKLSIFDNQRISNRCSYRAAILFVAQLTTKIRFVDLGVNDTFDADTQSIRQVTMTLTKKPTCAYRCLFKGPQSESTEDERRARVFRSWKSKGRSTDERYIRKIIYGLCSNSRW